ncbi:MAG: UPF0104 family protein [Calditrichaeota bacterium]|nr:MAG: UPF0104 family protein [Calditrichota bacterium]
MKKKIFFGIAISAIFLYMAFNAVDIKEMVSTLQNAKYWWLLPGLGFMFLSLIIRAYRWKLFMNPIKVVPTNKLFSAMMIGYMANNVFPLRLGEFMRAFAIGRSANISKASSFATILVERIIDVLSLLVIFGVTVLFHEFPERIEQAGFFIFLGAISLIFFIVMLLRKTQQTMHFVWRLSTPLPYKIKKTIYRMMRSFLQGFEVLRKSDHYGIILIQSILLWLLYAGMVYVTFYVFDLVPQGASIMIASLVLLVMVSIGIMIPASPGFVGTYHYFCIQGLALFGIDANAASSFAIILHLSNYIPMTLAGFIYFWKENLHFKDALEQKDATNQSEQPEPENVELEPR